MSRPGKLAKLVIGPGSADLKAQSLEAKLAGDTDRAIDLLTEAKLRDRQFARSLRTLRN
jgi:hypothetical protein